MSTLTSSPCLSPAVSPRNAFHSQHQRAPSNSAYRTSPSPRTAPRAAYPPLPSSSPRRAFANAPSASFVGGGKQRQREQYAESPTITKKEAPRSVDAGTQYSPDGYPPTADARRIPGAKAEGKQPYQEQHKTVAATAAATSPEKKRKERETSPPIGATGGLMSTSYSDSTSQRQPPNEPEPRRDPTPLPQQKSASAPTAGPSQQPQSEPQEARSTSALTSKRSRPTPGAAKVMPILYQHSHPKDLGILISTMLLELMALNDRIPLRDGRLTRFHSRAPPAISVPDYLQRLIHHATLSPPILLAMVWYIDQLCLMYPAFTVNSLTVHRFLITAACVAAKGLSDSFWTNPTYAKIGGVPAQELGTLELEFLERVRWGIVPDNKVLEGYYRSLVERTEGFEMEEESSSEEDGEAGEGEEMVVDEPT